ncbi:MAG: hypothetical protein KBA71_00145 [Opitutaceae bacterium]|nr:hypothetical protein [Opitutaceae bacterium]
MRTASHDSLPKTLGYLASKSSTENALRIEAILQVLDAGKQMMAGLRRSLAREGLTGEGFQVLSALADLPELAPLSDLIAIVDTPRPFLSETLTRLEYSGLIARQRGEVDRRMIRLQLTPAGRRAIDDARSLVQKSVWQILGDMNDDALRGLMARCAALGREAKAIGL